MATIPQVASDEAALAASLATFVGQVLPIQVAVVNESTVITDAQVAPVIAALQVQVLRDFAPVWGAPAKLSFYSRGSTIPPTAWQLALLDDSDQAGALGYHDITLSGQPLGKAFVKTTMADGLNWTVTASHELLEMLADPFVNVACEVDNSSGVPTTFYAREVADAPEDDQWGYSIGAVLVSDFVYPRWFMPGQVGPYDHMGHITSPFQLLAGGYISVLDVTTRNGWTQIQAEKAPANKNSRSDNRLELRCKQRSTWEKSTK